MRTKGLSLILVSLLFGGCASNTVTTELTQPEPDLQAEFTRCRDQAMAMDASARQQQSAAQYHRAAALFERCVGSYSRFGNAISADDMMQLQALSILDYLKAGDVELAKTQLQVMRSAFPHHDLYLEDGSSFVDTMSLLLESENPQQTQRRLLNTNKTVAAEYRRRQYWLQH